MFNLVCFAFKHYVQTQNVQQQKLSWFSITLSNSGKSLNNSFKIVLLKLIVLTNVFETCLQNRTKLTTWIISEQAPSLRHLARNNLGCQFCSVFEKSLRWTEIHFLNHHFREKLIVDICTCGRTNLSYVIVYIGTAHKHT